MITAKHHRVIYPLFQGLSHHLMRRHFHQMQIEGRFKDNGKAILVLANHSSWWDGFWLMQLNLKRLKRRFHFMMQEEQLKKHWYFRYTGGYSIQKKSRTALDSLQYTSELLQEQNNMVLLFPQGAIHSLYADVVTFASGTNRILHSLPPDTQILFVVNLPDYFAHKKPVLFTYLQHYLAKDLQHDQAEVAYQAFFQACKNTQKTTVC